MKGVSLVFAFLPSAVLVSADVYAASIDSGEAPYERCALCHGLYGDSARSKFPKLAALPVDYLEVQIQNFLSGERSNDGGQMSSIVTELAEGDIEVVVAWFASQAAPEPIEPATNDQLGKALYSNSGCADCHDESVVGFSEGLVPPLSSQHASYLGKQMKNMRDGERSGESKDLACVQSSSTMTDSEIELVADYLAAQPRVPKQ